LEEVNSTEYQNNMIEWFDKIKQWRVEVEKYRIKLEEFENYKNKQQNSKLAYKLKGYRWRDQVWIANTLKNSSYTLCYSCNMKKSGNVDGYVKGLHERYGEAYANYVNIELHSLYPSVKLGLIDLISAYEKAKAIEARLKRDLKLRTPDEVIHLKDDLNTEIGIYLFTFNNQQSNEKRIISVD
jgi:hypothetical protein